MSLLYQDPDKRPGSAAEALHAVRAAKEGLNLAIEAPGREATPDEVQGVLEGLIDPLWSHIFKPGTGVTLRYFEDGEPLPEEGESAFTCFVSSQGRGPGLPRGQDPDQPGQRRHLSG
jgi:hypothetical protein